MFQVLTKHSSLNLSFFYGVFIFAGQQESCNRLLTDCFHRRLEVKRQVNSRQMNWSPALCSALAIDKLVKLRIFYVMFFGVFYMHCLCDVLGQLWTFVGVGCFWKILVFLFEATW